MFKHIDVFILYKYGTKIDPALTPKILCGMYTQKYDIPFTVERLKSWFHQEPKTKYIVHALYSKGIQPKTIAEWLEINQSTISYHLNNPIKKDYVNPGLRMIENTIHSN